MDRGWPAWAGTWAAGGTGLLWAACLPVVRDVVGGLRADPGEEVVPAWAAWSVAVLAVLLLLAFVVGLSAWRRAPVLLRASGVVAGTGLLASAVVWTEVPGVGPLYPVLTTVAGLLALAGAALGPGSGGGTAAAWAAGVLTVAAGVALAVLGLRGLAYWQWRIDRPGIVAMLAAVVVGAVLVLAGSVGRWLPGRQGVLRVLAVAPLAVVGVSGLAWGLLWLAEADTLFHHEESELAWSWAAPGVSLGVGALAAAVAARRRWWSTAGVSVSAGVLVAVLAVLRESTIGNLV